ncbi:unnamed protein product [Ectocarpus sp. 6 AP-2014]
MSATGEANQLQHDELDGVPELSQECLGRWLEKAKSLEYRPTRHTWGVGVLDSLAGAIDRAMAFNRRKQVERDCKIPIQREKPVQLEVHRLRVARDHMLLGKLEQMAQFLQERRDQGCERSMTRRLTKIVTEDFLVFELLGNMLSVQRTAKNLLWHGSRNMSATVGPKAPKSRWGRASKIIPITNSTSRNISWVLTTTTHKVAFRASDGGIKITNTCGEEVPSQLGCVGSMGASDIPVTHRGYHFISIFDQTGLHVHCESMPTKAGRSVLVKRDVFVRVGNIRVDARDEDDMGYETPTVSSDRNALVALYRSTDGANWKKIDNWDTDAELSQWHGVQVNGGGRVVKLCLPNNNLQGRIPKELGVLSELETLELCENHLDGAIPGELGSLTELRTLILSKNQLTGCIPPELGFLGNLKLLRLSNNKLTGPQGADANQLLEYPLLKYTKSAIPAGLGMLDALEELDLRNNRLTGLFPTELRAMTNLKHLLLGGNKLTGGGPWVGEPLARWRARDPQWMYLAQMQEEQAKESRAEEYARLERQRAEERERQDRVQQGGDVSHWLRQDLGFNDDDSTVFGATLRAYHLHSAKSILAMQKQNLLSVLGDVGMPELLIDVVMEAWYRKRKEDEDCYDAVVGTAVMEPRQGTEEKVAKAEDPAQNLLTLHTPVGRWLKMEAHFNDTQASRFCAGLESLGISSTNALNVEEEAQQQLALDLKMNIYETRMFMDAMQNLRSKSAVSDVHSSTANAGASFVNLVQLRDRGGMATVFTANQLVDSQELTATKPVVLKRSDKDQQAAYRRESRILQYLSRPGGATAGFVVRLLEAYSTREYNFIAMEHAGTNLTTRMKELKKKHVSEQEAQIALWGQQACQVLVALHDLGIVWGDVKPDNFVCRGDHLIAIDFGSTCVEVGSVAQRELGADAETSFTSSPNDQFAWSVQYAAPERARLERSGHPCVARRSQDVWSLGMVLYYLSAGGKPYFPSPVDRTGTAIAQFRELLEETLSDDNFCVDLKNVRGTAWRCSLGLALITSEGERGTASEVLEAFSRGMDGLVSTISKTRGMEYITRKLAAISNCQEEILRRTGTTSDNVESVLQQQRDLRRRVSSMSTVLEHLAMDEMRMPHTFLVLPEKKSTLPRPKQWFADRGRLHFVCARGLELVPCGQDGTGFLVSRPKEWIKKHAMLLQVTVMTILAAGAVASSAASGGALGPVAASLALPFELIDLGVAYRFLSGTGGEEMDRMLDDISDALDPTKGEVGVPNLRGVKEVTGAEYRSVLNFLNTNCQGWDRQMGGMERTISADGVVGWVCPRHRSEWMSADVKGASTKATRASGSTASTPRRAEQAAASGCKCSIS